jgi:hypothetical protein
MRTRSSDLLRGRNAQTTNGRFRAMNGYRTDERHLPSDLLHGHSDRGALSMVGKESVYVGTKAQH